MPVSLGNRPRREFSGLEVKDDVKFDLNKLAAGEMFCVNCFWDLRCWEKADGTRGDAKHYWSSSRFGV